MIETLNAAIKIKKKDWKKIGGRLITKIITDAQKGKGQDNLPFRAYTRAYRDLKKTGKAVPGVATSSQVSPPNLWLTGAMFRSFHVSKATKKMVRLEYREGDRVIYNKDRGRNVHDLSDNNLQYVADEILKIVGVGIRVFAKKDVIVKVSV